MIAITALNDVTLASAIVAGVLAPSTSTYFTYKQLKINFLDRVDNYLMQMSDYYIRKWYLHPLQDKIIREQGEMLDIPPVDELQRLTKLVMINYDPAIDTPANIPSNVIPVGGMQIRAAKPLPDVSKNHLYLKISGIYLLTWKLTLTIFLPIRS